MKGSMKGSMRAADIYIGGEEGKVEEAMPKRFGEFFDEGKLFAVLAILTAALCAAVLLRG